eukprot:3908488-Pleurochrysis_carterae.AAC.1
MDNNIKDFFRILALSAPFIVDRRDFKHLFKWLNARGLCVKKDFDNKFPELVALIRRILDTFLREAVLETPESDDDVKNCKRPRDDESFEALESDDESPFDLLNAQQESSSESSSYDPEPSPDNEALAHLGPTPLPLSAFNELEQ